MQNKNFYFYNGFDKPEKIASNLKELKKITLSDNYLGDVTCDFLEELKSCIKSDNFEVLEYYNIYYNMDNKKVEEVALSWFEKNQIPKQHYIF